MRPEDPQQKGIKRLRLQSQLSVPVYAQISVSLLHLRDAGLAALGTGSTRLRSIRDPQGSQRRVSKLPAFDFHSMHAPVL